MNEGSAPAFAMVPAAAFADRRLTLEQLRVLGALCSFRRSKDDYTVWPRRDEIAKRCAMAACKVSEATTALEAHGWVSKEGKGGFSKACRYTIADGATLANTTTVPESVTVPHSATVPESVRGEVTYSVTGMRVTDSVTGKEEKINKEEREGEQARPSPTEPKKKRKPTSQEITLDEFLANCKAEKVKPIADDDPIWDFAESAGIAPDMIGIAWREFKRCHHGNPKKRQIDWRKHFRNAVRRNWYGIWFLKEGQPAGWTTAGEGMRREAA